MGIDLVHFSDKLWICKHVFAIGGGLGRADREGGDGLTVKFFFGL